MASIKQRKSKFSVIYWYMDDTGERKQKWDTLETKKEAKARKAFIEFYQQTYGYVLVPLEEQFAHQREEAEQAIDTPDDEITLKEFLVTFVNLYGVSKWSANTYSSKLSSINNYINPIIGDWKLNEITTKKLSQYYNDLLSVPEVPRANRKATGRCVQPANIKKIHDIIRCALNQAIRWEYLDSKMRNPASLATLPKVPKVKRKVWNVQTFKEAIKLVDDDLLLLCMHLAFACSLRVGEITGLTWDDVDIDNGIIFINKQAIRLKNHETKQSLTISKPKTDAGIRTIYMTEYVKELFRQQQQISYKTNSNIKIDNCSNFVFTTNRGTNLSARALQYTLKYLSDDMNASRKVILPHVTPHVLRHTACTKMINSGMNIKAVQTIMGHADIGVTLETYTHINNEQLRNEIKKLEYVSD